jgi:pimeloyl-ACP methyl ester carboxylesterase
MRPETLYAKTTDGVHIAYQVVGKGSIDVVFVMGWTTNIEALWEEPSLAKFLARLASISRLIVFDKRGVGLSDRVPEAALPTLETRMDDVRAVMEAAGSERAVVFGVSEGGPLSLLFAATYPERTTALILFGTMARFAWAPDFPWGVTAEKLRDDLDGIDHSWGTEEYASSALRSWAAPGSAEDPRLLSWLASYTRRAASPGAAMALERMNYGMDVRHVLGAIHVPTLVLGRVGDKDFPIDATRQMASEIQGAKLVEFPGDDHFFWIGDQDALLDEIERFLAGVRDDEAELDRVLATVLFTDIVGSRSERRRWGTAGGANCSRRITQRSAHCSEGSAGERSTPPAMGSSPPSAVLFEPCGVRWRRPRRSRTLGWRFELGFTPGRLNSPTRACGGSPCTSAPGSPRSQELPRFLPPPR